MYMCVGVWSLEIMNYKYSDLFAAGVGIRRSEQKKNIQNPAHWVGITVNIPSVLMSNTFIYLWIIFKGILRLSRGILSSIFQDLFFLITLFLKKVTETNMKTMNNMLSYEKR